MAGSLAEGPGALHDSLVAAPLRHERPGEDGLLPRPAPDGSAADPDPSASQIRQAAAAWPARRIPRKGVRERDVLGRDICTVPQSHGGA